MMKNVMVGNIGGKEFVGTNENGIGTVVCKLEDVPDIVKERDRLVNLETDRKNAISKMSKSWQHNADDNDDLLTRFVEMANRQFEERDRLREMLILTYSSVRKDYKSCTMDSDLNWSLYSDTISKLLNGETK